MAPKKSKNRAKKKAGGDATADCVLPRDIMLLVLTRLPVKSILRFKCVCKPWYKLVSSPKFIRMHMDQFCRNPQNEGLMVYCVSAKNPHSRHIISLFQFHATPCPRNLVHPYSKFFPVMDFVGCVNGLVCLSMPPYGQWVDLWNPATDLYKTIPLPKLPHGKEDLVSLGFGYDDDDFKVVRIVCYKDKKKHGRNGFEVYSAKSNSWTTIDVVFDFGVSGTTNDAIVNGNPYWLAKVDDNGGVLMCFFDVTKMVFNFVPISTLTVGESEKAPLVNWNGSLALLPWKKDNQGVLHSIHVWVFDDAKRIWTLDHAFGPIDLKVDRLLQCSKNGKILGECSNGDLFLFDSVDGSVNKIVTDGAEKYSFECHGYTESLACIKGMEKVAAQKETEKAAAKAAKKVDIERYMNLLYISGNFPLTLPWRS